MKRCAIILVLLAAGGVVMAQAQQGPTTAPAVAPAPAQCPVSGATTAPLGDSKPAGGPRPAADAAQCPVSGATTAPAGGPRPAAGKPMSAAMAEMLGLTSPTGAEATTQPAGSASISIQAVQGTKDGPKITGGKATIKLYRGRGIEPEVLEANLDEHGTGLLENLSLARPFQPVVTIEHAGVSYQAVGEPMTPASPSQKIEVTIYETTDQRPELMIQMRYVRADATPEGLHIADMMIVNNPTDRAWLGSAGPDGKRSAMWVALPAGAKDIAMDGDFHECCARVEDGKVVSSAPLVPGQSQFSLEYMVPGDGGLASVTIDAPAPVRGMTVMVPEDQVGNIRVEGLEKSKTFPPKGMGVALRSFKGEGIVPGRKIVLTMTGLPLAAEGETFWTTQKIVGIVAGALILVLCIIFLAARPRRKSGQAEAQA